MNSIERESQRKSISHSVVDWRTHLGTSHWTAAAEESAVDASEFSSYHSIERVEVCDWQPHVSIRIQEVVGRGGKISLSGN